MIGSRLVPGTYSTWYPLQTSQISEGFQQNVQNNTRVRLVCSSWRTGLLLRWWASWWQVVTCGWGLRSWDEAEHSGVECRVSGVAFLPTHALSSLANTSYFLNEMSSRFSTLLCRTRVKWAAVLTRILHGKVHEKIWPCQEISLLFPTIFYRAPCHFLVATILMMHIMIISKDFS